MVRWKRPTGGSARFVEGFRRLRDWVTLDSRYRSVRVWENGGVSRNSSYSIFRVFSVSFSCFEVVREGSAVHESIRLMICYESVLMVQSRLDWIEYMRFRRRRERFQGARP